MKFNVSSSKLFSQLQAVSRVINSKNALPILDDVLFELQGNQLTLTASDSETTMRTSIEVEGAEGGGKVASAAKSCSACTVRRWYVVCSSFQWVTTSCWTGPTAS